MTKAHEAVSLRENGGQFRIEILPSMQDPTKYDLLIFNEEGAEIYALMGWKGLSAQDLNNMRELITFVIESIGVTHFVDQGRQIWVSHDNPFPWPELPPLETAN